jgi:hypothetical protein
MSRRPDCLAEHDEQRGDEVEEAASVTYGHERDRHEQREEYAEEQRR